MDFEQIYQAYFHDVFLYLCSLSSNEDIAEEMTQETFVKALKAIDQFDGIKGYPGMAVCDCQEYVLYIL